MPSTTNSANDTYFLSRGGPAEWRLSYQHLLVTKHQGYLIHPKIEKEISQRENLRIADLATGNGIWAVEVAEKYVKAQVLGTDISDKQFPLLSARLPNTNFELQNLFEEVPQKYLGAFDVVHMRLTIGWIGGKDTDLLVRNVLAMLKPGGFVQWSENSSPGIWTYEANGKVHASLPRAWQNAVDLTGMQRGLDWISRLDQKLRQCGAIDTEVSHDKPPASILLGESHLLDWTLQEIFENLVKLGVPGAKEAQASWSRDMDQEYSEGRQFAYHWQTVIARKAIESK